MSLGNVVFVLQIVCALAFVVLMAIQTDKAEQSGVMGLGAQGGRMSGSIDMPVGAERILKPLTKWIVIGFLFLSALSSISGALRQIEPRNTHDITPWHFLGFLVTYLLVMLFGNRVWASLTGTNR